MPRIDDPFDAVNEQCPEHPTHPISRILECPPVSILIDVGAEMHPFAGMANAVRKFFSKGEAAARVKALLQVLEKYVRDHDQQIEELSTKMDSPEFVETLLVAVDETLRTANAEKIKRFALVLGHDLLSDGDARSYEDAATYIRTLSELGEADIEVLSILHAFQADLAHDASMPYPGRLFWGSMAGVKGEVAERGIPHDEFISRCSKLNGYGLVHKADYDDGPFLMPESDDMSYALETIGYLITRGGKKLMDILGNSPELLTLAGEHRKQVLDSIEQLKAGSLLSFPPPYRRRTT